MKGGKEFYQIILKAGYDSLVAIRVEKS